jgi:hypothetical protein
VRGSFAGQNLDQQFEAWAQGVSLRFIETRVGFSGFSGFMLTMTPPGGCVSHFAISLAKAHPQMERFFFSPKGQDAIYPLE